MVWGVEFELEAQVYLPDSIRARHVHILGATGSGKIGSVILNFLRQDILRGLVSMILNAKADYSFLEELELLVPKERLWVFDLSSEETLGYNPLESGSPLESAQRLFSSLTWSEEYYKSKARSAFQRICQIYVEVSGKNPTLWKIANYLDNPKRYAGFVSNSDFPENLAMTEFQELLGLCDQICLLTMGHLAKSLSPKVSGIDLSKASAGFALHFSHQSIGDVIEVSLGFLNRITDNAAKNCVTD